MLNEVTNATSEKLVVQKFVLTMLVQTPCDRGKKMVSVYENVLVSEFLLLQFYTGFGFSSVIDNGKTQVLHRGHY